MSLVGKQSNFERIFTNLISVFLIFFISLYLEFIGVENYIQRMTIIFFISWALLIFGFFFVVYIKNKYLNIIIVRLVKDAPLMFVVFFIMTAVQPMFFGDFSVGESGGIPMTAFNENLFFIVFAIVVLFASNVHKITEYILVDKKQYIHLKNILGRGESDKKFAKSFDKSQKNFEEGMKFLTYFIMAFQVFLALFLVIPLIIFQKIIPNDLIFNFLNSILFFSFILFPIGVIKLITLFIILAAKNKIGVKK